MSRFLKRGKKKPLAVSVIHRKFSYFDGVVEQTMTEHVHRLRGVLGKDKFLLCSRFIINAIHNVLRHPDESKYRKITTKSQMIADSLTGQVPEALLEKVNMTRKDKTFYIEYSEDPSSLQQLNDALVEARKELYVLEAWEVHKDDIEKQKLLGSGQFGEVYAGRFCGEKVAIKLLKPEADAQSTKDFKEEADIMKVFKHTNVMSLIGVVMMKKPWMLIMSLMDNGLKDILRAKSFSTTDQLEMGLQTALGLEHLHLQNIIHCDLASRNVLVSSSGVLKIADFGLARNATSKSCDVSKRVFPIAIRWSAPEVWEKRRLSFKTDIWSWAVLFYEILTSGAVPYLRWKNAQTKEKVAGGYRLPAPEGSPEEFYKLMLQCWSATPSDRPFVSDVVANLVQTKISLKLEKQHINAPQEEEEEEEDQFYEEEQELKEAGALQDEDVSPDSPLVQKKTVRLKRKGAKRQKETVQDMDAFAEYMKRAGFVLLPGLEQESSTDHEVEIDISLPLDQQPFYHGVCSRKVLSEETEPLLCHNGQFIVHALRGEGKYVLSAMFQMPWHILIHENNKKFYMGDSDQYDSIAELIDYYYSVGQPFLFNDVEIPLTSIILADSGVDT